MTPLSVLTCFSLIAAALVAGAVSKEEAGFYELRKGNFSVKLTNWGASLVSVLLPDKHGKTADVVLGYDSAEEYKNNTPNFGATVGRVANRIRGAEFYLDGKLYKLIPNDGNNTIHGGPNGFGKVAWKTRKLSSHGPKPYITFSYSSPDGDQGFPGEVSATVKYMLVGDYSLGITMSAKVAGKPTPVNIAHHTYWNLAGHNAGNVLHHLVRIRGSRVTQLDQDLIPTGKLADVKGTPYDFLQVRRVGSRIRDLPRGYDINYAVDGRGEWEGMRTVAEVYEKGSGRAMEVMANQVGVQFYTANNMKNKVGKGGFVYRRYGGLCLETQGFPDAVHQPSFPSTIVSPGRIYRHWMVFRFSIMKKMKGGDAGRG